MYIVYIQQVYEAPTRCLWHTHARTHREIFSEILLNQIEMRLYLPFSDRYGTKRKSVWFQIDQKMVHTI